MTPFVQNEKIVSGSSGTRSTFPAVLLGSILSVVAALGMGIPDVRAQEPSFDCQRATSKAEHAICGSPQLMLLDRQLAELYAIIMGKAGAAEASQLKQSHRNWLVARDACTTVDCLSKSMLERFGTLVSESGGASTQAQTKTRSTSGDIVETYTAVIAQADRRNSSGASLRSVADILAQDRANVHRFGIRQTGDSEDSFFRDRVNRTLLPRLLARGRVEPDAEQAILSGGDVAIRVELHGLSDTVESVSVQLDNPGVSSLVSSAQPILPGPFSRQKNPAGSWLSAPQQQPASGQGDPGTAALGSAPAGGLEQGAGEGVFIQGNEEIARHLALWVIGQRPWLVREPGVYLEFSNNPLPPDFPTMNYNGAKGREEIARVTNQYLDAIAAKAADYALPDRIAVDVRVSLTQKVDGSQVRLTLSDVSTPHANMGLEETVPAALRTLQIQSPYDSGMARLTEVRPVPLPLPEGLAKDKTEVTLGSKPDQWVDVFPENNVYVRFTLALREGRIILTKAPGRAPGNHNVAAEIQMHVLDAVLIRQPWGGKKGARPDEIIVHHWEVENTDAPMSVASLDSLEEVAARYNLGTSNDGRLIHLNSFLRKELGLGTEKGGWGDSTNRAADLALRAAAVIRAYPERKLDVLLAVKLAFDAMLPAERDAILPVGFQPTAQDSSMNDLEWSIALREAEPYIRKAMLASAPRLPLSVRSYVNARLEEYSLELGGFPVRVEGGLDWLPVPPAEVGLNCRP
ncbi:lysozyme inhibitor LprI family protein [Rhizobium sp. SL86]|uniref:lysozyme inhibitor LprI family protein n=1 Tax=Rhizobium sp. SL86 TaxID=2995148 RepID=UPI00227480AA|nr:lysozyme inhibitor LprI family protein [Rhizobium sp. SL86]MCY1668984.1 hypothetical protein [Rhizobium sp. SL86]